MFEGADYANIRLKSANTTSANKSRWRDTSRADGCWPPTIILACFRSNRLITALHFFLTPKTSESYMLRSQDRLPYRLSVIAVSIAYGLCTHFSLDSKPVGPIFCGISCQALPVSVWPEARRGGGRALEQTLVVTAHGS